MGHTRLGTLPRTRNWRQVVELIEGGATTAEIAAKTMDAAARAFKAGGRDEGLVHSLWLLMQIPLAARGDDFVARLHQLGVHVSEQSTLFEVVGAFADAVDTHLRRFGGRTDFGEMAQLAAVESLTAEAGNRMPVLFGATPDSVRRGLRDLSVAGQFGRLGRDFFARLASRYLMYFLSRELSNHVGRNRRFADLGQHAEFCSALELHCREASRIVEEFSGDWYSKADYEGEITPEKTAGFAHEALSKIRGELTRRTH